MANRRQAIQATLSPRRLAGFGERLGADPDDSVDARFQKTLLVNISAMTVVAGVIWGTVYAASGEPLPALVPFAYSLYSAFTIAVFAVTRRYRLFRLTQRWLILVLPFLMMASLGGFETGSAVIVWALLCPLGALMFAKRREAAAWFGAYIALLGLSGVLEFVLDGSDRVPSEVVASMYVLNLGGVSLIAFVLVAYFSGQNDQALKLLSIEREKSDDLLRNVLPSDIATELKEHGSVVARRFDAVSVLFADIVGSTQLTVRLAPEELVEVLNRIFTQFDRIADRYGAEKIRTIGDNYMAATGVPHPSPSHATDLANMALDMMASITSINTAGGVNVQFRIGLNTGPVIAGVVGQRKFHYDIWGDAVNTASRMESHGVPGKIQITRVLKELLEDDFSCVARGTVDVKGMGETECWFLEGRLPSSAGASQPIPEG